ncbi:MAG: HTH domain-containing protein [Candidatus Moraniibacteriota bacterium]|jgi:DNA-directed RNA polymerase delta subunit
MNSTNNNSSQFYEVLGVILSDMPERSQSIVERRFGVGLEKPETLQAIGDEYGVTRERVRQIVQSGLKMNKNVNSSEEVDNVKKQIIAEIGDNGGVLHIDKLLELGGENNKEKGAIRFLVEGMDEISYVNSKKHPVIKGSVVVTEFDMDEWSEMHDSIKNIFEDKQKTYSSERLQEKMSNVQENMDLNKLESYLVVSSEIDKNPFDKWGLSGWDEISPRGVREKSLLIMKEKDTPMHFREIAQAIDDYGLGKKGKKSHPQTVHNELIRDDNFVLVGRGVYALNFNEYEEGTVKDIVLKILEEAGGPMPADDIVEKVLQVRHVKPTTVRVNLSLIAKKVNGHDYTLDTNAS